MCMYSSKFKLIRLPLKFIEPFFGLAFNNLGISVSLGPPVGAMICAQPLVRTML